MIEAKEDRVYKVFENISKDYDKGNRRISLGMQDSWKGLLIENLTRDLDFGGSLLDVCCGTGDIGIAVAKKRQDVNVVGVDFSKSMLEEAKKKRRNIKNVRFMIGDAQGLPFKENSFSAVCISFGLRNTKDYEAVLREIKRVVIPGGSVYCLDSFVPKMKIIKPFYQIYFKYLMPILGGGKKHYKEYIWLYESTKSFIRIDDLMYLYNKVGLSDVEWESRMMGACCLIQGRKP